MIKFKSWQCKSHRVKLNFRVFRDIYKDNFKDQRTFFKDDKSNFTLLWSSTNQSLSEDLINNVNERADISVI